MKKAGAALKQWLDHSPEFFRCFIQFIWKTEDELLCRVIESEQMSDQEYELILESLCRLFGEEKIYQYLQSRTNKHSYMNNKVM